MFGHGKIPLKFIKNIVPKLPFIRLQILHILSQKPIYGHKIVTELNSRMKGSPPKLNPNVLYPLLHNFEKEGLITGKWDHPQKRTRRLYSMTPKGKLVLKQMKEASKPIIKEMFQSMRKFIIEMYGEDLTK